MVGESRLVATFVEVGRSLGCAAARALPLRLLLGAQLVLVGVGLACGGCGSERPRNTTATRDGGVTTDASADAAGQVTERCNGLDDDGDGQVDEPCDCTEGATQPCYGGRRPLAGVGACVRGTQRCDRRLGDEEFAQWRWGACEGWLGPEGKERCGDSADNDCDGTVNEGCACAPGERAACYPGPADTAGVGVCASGSRTCAAGAGEQSGVWGECTGAVTPAATDTCGDALDDDCDGTVDEGCTCALGQREDCYEGPAGTAGVGDCRKGQRSCVAGAGGEGSVWSTCSGAVTPAATDTCDDSRDNNCDGVVDDGCGNQVRYADISDIAAPRTYVEAAIDPRDPATWYVVDFNSVISRTTDAGASFAALCRVPEGISGLLRNRTGWGTRQEARLLVSPAADRSAYLTLSAQVLRIDALGPTVDCPAIRQSPYWPPEHTFGGTAFAIDPQSGELWSWSYDDPAPGQLFRSADRGQSWRQVNATLTSDAFLGSLAVDPADGQHLLALSVRQTTNGGIYESRDGGSSWTRRSAATVSWASRPALRFDPRHPGSVYVNTGAGTTSLNPEGFVSIDGGTHWAPSAAHGIMGEWAIDPSTGAGFRFRKSTSGSGIVLERAPDLRQPVWSVVHTFATDFDDYARVDAAGQTVVAIVGMRLWVSRDGGSSFTGPLGGSKPVVSGVRSIDSVDGRTIYAVSDEWDVYRSTDAGASFTRVYRNTAPRDQWRAGDARLRVHPARPQQVLVWVSLGFYPALLRTTDAFQTADFQPGGSYASARVLALSATDPDVAFFFGDRSLISTDAGARWSGLAVLPTSFTHLWNPTSAWVLPGSPYRALVIAGPHYATPTEAYLYDHATTTQSDYSAVLRSALGNTRPGAIEVFPSGANSVVRVIGATGRLAESTDGGRSFAAVPGAVGGLPECTFTRHLASLASDRRVLAAWCWKDDLHISKDGGRSWEAVRGPAWRALDCLFGDHGRVVVTAGELIVTCEPQSPSFVHSQSPLLLRVGY